MAARIWSQWLARNRRRKAREAAVRRRQGCRLALEQLEERTVPAVIFNSALGGDSIFWAPGNGAGQPANQAVTSPITNNPTVLNNPSVYLIFWGQSWTNATAQQFATDASTIIQSPYFS